MTKLKLKNDRAGFVEEVIHPIALIDPHIAAFHQPGSHVSDQYRTAFAGLQALEHPPHSMVITSVSSGEGRSVACLNLAVTIAKETSKRVLVIDCDFHHPTLHEYLSLPFEGGILDVIKGSCELDSSIKKTIVPNLFLLTSGAIPEHLFGICSSPEFKSAVNTLKEKFDYILFDSAPLDHYPDSALIGQHLDGAVMIVRSEVTQREALETAKEKLENLQVHIFGCILIRYKYHIPLLIHKFV